MHEPPAALLLPVFGAVYIVEPETIEETIDIYLSCNGDPNCTEHAVGKTLVSFCEEGVEELVYYVDSVYCLDNERIGDFPRDVNWYVHTAIADRVGPSANRTSWS